MARHAADHSVHDLVQRSFEVSTHADNLDRQIVSVQRSYDQVVRQVREVLTNEQLHLRL